MKNRSQFLCCSLFLLVACLLFSSVAAYAEDETLTNNNLDLKIDRLEKGTGDESKTGSNSLNDESLFNPVISTKIKEQMAEQAKEEEKRGESLFSRPSPKMKEISSEALFIMQDSQKGSETGTKGDQAQNDSTTTETSDSKLSLVLTLLCGGVVIAGLIASYKLFTGGEQHVV